MQVFNSFAEMAAVNNTSVYQSFIAGTINANTTNDESQNAAYHKTTQDMVSEFGMTLKKPTELAVPKWNTMLSFENSAQLKRFLILHDNNAFDHLSADNFHDASPDGKSEIARMIQSNR